MISLKPEQHFVPVEVPTDKPSVGRGGPREGAGRKPLPPDKKLTPKTVYLLPSWIRRVERAGGGDFPKGMRKCLRKLFRRKPKKL